MARDFYTAFLPETTRILGLPLLPLSLGHRIILRKISSPFLAGGNIDIDDLACAAMVCAQSYQDALSSFSDPDLDSFMTEWHEKISKEGPIDYSANLLEFFAYLERNSQGPNYAWDDRLAKTIDCPVEQVIKVCLMRDLHFSESEILDRPWRLCLWDYATLKAMSGAVQLFSEDTLNGAKETAEALAELAKEGRLTNGHQAPTR